jgi:uncharacterized protein
MTAEYLKPLPLPTDENMPFLEGLKEGKVRVQQCSNCSAHRYPAAQFCPHCLSQETEWKEASGRGTIYSFIIIHQLYHPGFRDDLPYNVAVVEFEEGPRIVTNVVGCANEDLRIGMAVTAEIVQATPEAAILKFRPVA